MVTRIITVFILAIFTNTYTYSQDKQAMVTSDLLYEKGIEYYNWGKYEQALPYFQELLALDSIIYKKIRPQKIIYSGMWLGNTLYKLGREKEAQKNYYSSLYYKAPPIDYREMILADSLSKKARCLEEQKEYESAICLFEMRKQLVDSILTPQHIWAINSNLIIAGLYQKLIKQTLSFNIKTNIRRAYTADSLYNKYLEGVKEYYGENSKDYIFKLLNSGEFFQYSLYLHSNQWVERTREGYNLCCRYLPNEKDWQMHAILKMAEAEQECIFSYYREIFIPTTSQLCFIDSIYNHAATLYEEYLQYAEKNLSTLTLLYPKESLEKLYWRRPNLEIDTLYTIPDSKFLEMYEIQDSMNSQTKEIVEDINQTGLSEIMGRLLFQNSSIPKLENKWHQKAREICQERIDILQKEESYYQELYGALNDMRNHYEYDNKFKEALPFALEIMNIAKEHKLELEYVAQLSYIANLYENMKEYTNAIEYEEQFLDKAVGYISSQRNAVKKILEISFLLLKESGDSIHIEKALFLADKYKHAFSENEENLRLHELIANNLYSIGSSIGNKNILSKAIDNYIICYDLCKTNKLEKVNYARRISHCYSCCKDDSNKYKWDCTIFELQRDRVLRNFLYANKSLRSYIWNSEINDFLEFIRTANTEKAYEPLAFNAILFIKGLLLNSEIALTNVIEEKITQDKNFAILYNEWQKVDRKDIEKTNEIERQIMLSCKNLPYNQYLKVSYKDILSKLKKDDAVIEFISLPMNKDSIMYMAMVLKKETGIPRLIPLFESRNLQVINKSTIYTSPVLSNLVWRPLSAELDGINNIYFSPDGELHNIAIESLPHWDNKDLVSEHWNFYRLSSTRELALSQNKNIVRTASIYGGLKYDMDAQILINDSKKHQRKRDFITKIINIVDTLSLRGGVRELPGTKEEVVNVDKALSSINIIDSLYTDTIGTEASFKALSGKKMNLLHIATHGFYWTEREANTMNNLSFLSLENDNSIYVEDKALTRSGILFAGVNNALKGKILPKDVDDGILTAKEISTLDLRGLDLVVLSACQTGLGEITGDGVFGLQRGFKKAGANSLLMSLWKVDDKATQILMNQFYSNLIVGKSKIESLHNAQQYVRKYEIEVEEKPNTRPAISAHAKEQVRKESKKEKTFRKIKPYKDSQYWAAFILLDAIY